MVHLHYVDGTHLTVIISLAHCHAHIVHGQNERVMVAAVVVAMHLITIVAVVVEAQGLPLAELANEQYAVRAVLGVHQVPIGRAVHRPGSQCIVRGHIVWIDECNAVVLIVAVHAIVLAVAHLAHVDALILVASANEHALVTLVAVVLVTRVGTVDDAVAHLVLVVAILGQVVHAPTVHLVALVLAVDYFVAQIIELDALVR